MIRIVLFCAVLFLVLFPRIAEAQTLSPMHERLQFLVGTWQTDSEFANGTHAPGTLTYAWVLGGAWLKVTFDGKPPSGAMWEAHVMMKYDPEQAHYVSYAFFNADGPTIGTGVFVSDTLFRLTLPANGGEAGIDYHDKGDGTVYQENWFLPENGEARQITLRTQYTRQ